MHSSRKFCSMRLETGTLVFAILSSIATILTSLGFLYYLIHHLQTEQGDTENDFALLGVTVVFIAYFMMAFGFSVLLADGVIKRKRRYLKIYFVYGAIIFCMAIITILAIGICSINRVQDTSFALMMIALGVVCPLTFSYGLALTLIWKTYKKFESETQFINKYYLK